MFKTNWEKWNNWGHAGSLQQGKDYYYVYDCIFMSLLGRNRHGIVSIWKKNRRILHSNTIRTPGKGYIGPKRQYRGHGGFSNVECRGLSQRNGGEIKSAVNFGIRPQTLSWKGILFCIFCPNIKRKSHAGVCFEENGDVSHLAGWNYTLRITAT